MNKVRKIEILQNRLDSAQTEIRQLKEKLVRKEAEIDERRRHDCEKILRDIKGAKKYFSEMLNRIRKEGRRSRP